MSWKGFKKAVTRLPQQVLQKAGYADETFDEEYEEVEGGFKELEQSAKVLAEESSAYVIAVKTLLAEQIKVGQALQQLMALNADPPVSEHLAAIEAYVAASTTWSESMAPYVDQTLQNVVVDPANALVLITRQARSMLDKRGRKVVDYDRTRNALKKAKEKIETSPSVDVTKLTKAEIEFEEARRDYDAINSRLKTELPVLMHLRIAFMDPVLEALLSFQIYFFEQGAAALQSLSSHVALTKPIMETFTEKRAPGLEFLKGLSLVIPIKLDPTADPSARNEFMLSGGATAEEPPAYSDPANQQPEQAKASSSSSPSFAAPPAAPRPARNVPEPQVYAIALYPFQSDQEGDLTFDRDEKIHVVQRTDNQQDWWVGRIGNRQGSFPANYVKLL